MFNVWIHVYIFIWETLFQYIYIWSTPAEQIFCKSSSLSNMRGDRSWGLEFDRRRWSSSWCGRRQWYHSVPSPATGGAIQVAIFITITCNCCVHKNGWLAAKDNVYSLLDIAIIISNIYIAFISIGDGGDDGDSDGGLGGEAWVLIEGRGWTRRLKRRQFISWVAGGRVRIH